MQKHQHSFTAQLHQNNCKCFAKPASVRCCFLHLQVKLGVGHGKQHSPTPPPTPNNPPHIKPQTKTVTYATHPKTTQAVHTKKNIKLAKLIRTSLVHVVLQKHVKGSRLFCRRPFEELPWRLISSEGPIRSFSLQVRTYIGKVTRPGLFFSLTAPVFS